MVLVVEFVGMDQGIRLTHRRCHRRLVSQDSAVAIVTKDIHCRCDK